MAAEEIHVGHLVFEEDDDLDGMLAITVRKMGDLEGWVTMIPCPDDDLEWAGARNRCFPFNGREGPPPLGQWIVYEFVGKESASLNLELDRSIIGFTNYEIVTIIALVNMAYFGRTRKLREEVIGEHKVTH